MRACTVCRLNIAEAKRRQLPVGFHRSPVDPEQLKAWEQFCYSTNRKAKKGREIVVCSYHFADDCFRTGTKRYMLKDKAIPTIREGWKAQKHDRFVEVKKHETVVEILEMGNACRICESKASLHDLSAEENAEHARRFCSLTAIPIDSTAPWFCCVVCLGALNEAYGFVQRCIEAEDRRKRSLGLDPTVVVKHEEQPVEVWEEPMEEFNVDSSGDREDEDSSDDFSSDSEPKSKVAKVYTCEACQATFDNQKDKLAHVKIHGRERFPCEQCGKAFRRRYDLDAHLNTHKTEPSFFCSQCPMGFKTPNNLGRHMKSVHLKLKPYSCEECGRAFAQKTQLEAHAAVHMTEPDTPCQLCDKMFKTKARLRTHMSIEHGQNGRVYECTTCRKSFSSPQSLYNHKSTHHEPNFLCSICGNKFRTKVLLNCHLTSHNTEQPFHCEQCPAKFKSSKALHYHQLVHSGLKPHPCGLCNRMFRSRTHLKTHTMSVHTKEKPHECLVCGRRFTLPGNLRLHMKGHVGRQQEEDSPLLKEEGEFLV